MVVDVIYTASSGTEYHLQSSGLRIKEANFHRWDFRARGAQYSRIFRVDDFGKEALHYVTTLSLGGPLAARKALIEELHRNWEADIRNNTPGRITWGDYYLDCYIISSDTYPDRGGWYTVDDITIYAPRPFWIKPATFDIPASSTPSRITPETRRESPYILTLYGPAANLHFDIARHANYQGPRYEHYFSDVTLAAGEYITIDSTHRTITKTDAGGVVTNFFSSRMDNSPLWWYFPAHYLGNPALHYVDVFSSSRAELTLYQERSEPK